MPHILALDTATNACSAAFSVDGTVQAARHELMVRGHAERLMPMIAEVMAEAGAEPDTLDLIAVTVGPGAFTGLRVGLAAARGLALAGGIPAFGMTTTEVLAAGVAGPWNGLVVALESKREDLFVQVFDANGIRLSDPVALVPAALVDFVGETSADNRLLALAGDGAARAGDVLAAAGFEIDQRGPDYPDARCLAALAETGWQPGQPLAAPAPLYLRPPDAVVPKDGGRLRL
ncbi:MAG: tRNA (adenosine(37)-N6)-threonylcarbamoyltransferase complex dimerization subunit type 1 TsaB [Rhodospirillaceae bacterium]|jgi:tRNA threonylcarbamoyladenosine biosynthesis protein TsaB|nr:tRNA (adenosine(37)-N6)-threonylcarbamoyltransferase complex dimerization subunit type 1 TsaB [Rhodospirillaceae bacterium]